MTESGQPSTKLGTAMRRHSRLVAVAGILLLVVVLWIALGFERGGGRSPDESAGAIRVNVIEVAPQTVPLHPRYLAQTESSQIVEIRSRIRGFLNERHFREGGIVERDEILFTVDPKPYEAAMEVARARVVSAEARLDQAERQVERYRGLYEQGAATASELEEWETAMQVAASDIELYKAQRTQADLDLSYTTISSPINGVVGRALKDVGTFVDDGSNSLLAVVEAVDPIYVRFSMSEQNLLRYGSMRETGRLTGPEGEDVEVSITLRDGSDFEHLGRISFVDVRIDDATSTVLLRATVPNPDLALRPGQFVHVNLLGLERPSIVVIPKQAVVQTPTSASVYVVDEEQAMVTVRMIRLGDWHENGWIVEEGLEEGDVVVVDNIMRLRPGTPVAIDERLSVDDFDGAPIGEQTPSMLPGQ